MRSAWENQNLEAAFEPAKVIGTQAAYLHKGSPPVLRHIEAGHMTAPDQVVLRL
jgi:hypothetical protein